MTNDFTPQGAIPLRILFMGTPDFAAICLRAVYEKCGGAVVGVVSQPDRPKGRGMKLVPTPVKAYAESVGLPVFQPETLRNGAFEGELRSLAPDLIFVAAYGKILPQDVLDFPKYGCINAHASLLPKFQGASPIQRAIMAGERETGVTAMRMEAGIDTGAMLLRRETPIFDSDDYGSLHDRLAALGGEALCEVVDRILDGTLTETPQDRTLATYAPKLRKEEAVLDFTRPARELWNQVRALSPSPLAETRTPDGRRLKVALAAWREESVDREPGTMEVREGALEVACGEGVLRLLAVVPEGRGRMDVKAYLNGCGKLFQKN